MTRNEIVKRVSQAMREHDRWSIRLRYRDKFGDTTDRYVSPVRMLGLHAFLGLCLSREEPRRFEFARCVSAELVRSHELTMPCSIETVRDG